MAFPKPCTKAVGHNQRTCTTRCVLPELPPERLSVVVWEAPHCSSGLLPGVGRGVNRHATYLLPAGRTTIRPARVGDGSRWLEGKSAFKIPIPTPCRLARRHAPLTFIR